MRLLILLVVLVSLPLAAAQAAGDPYLGLRHEPSQDPPGLRIDVVPGAPAEASGLRSGDIITAIDGVQMADAAEGNYAAVLSEALAGKQIGDTLQFSVHRSTPRARLSVDGSGAEENFPIDELRARVQGLQEGQTLSLDVDREVRLLEISVVLGPRPDTLGEPFPPNADLACDTPYLRPQVGAFLEALIEQRGIISDCEDLYARLDRRATPDDGYRLQRTVYLLRDGLKGEAVIRKVTGKLSESMVAGIDGYSQVQYTTAELMDVYGLDFPEMATDGKSGLDDDLQLLSDILASAQLQIEQAFSGYSEEELEFLDRQRAELTEAFRQWHYIDSEDSNKRRVEDNLRLIQLARKLDYEALMKAQLELSKLSERGFLTRLEQGLRERFAGQLEEDELLRMETPAGDIVVNGTGRSWQRTDDAACRIDLGGDDFYSNAAGSATGLSHRLGVLIEFGGNDAYESTTHYSQGCGSLGCGLLIDLQGSDHYIGLQWAQGSAFFGSGALVDYEGDDIYRGEELCQAAAIFGSAVLYDISGNDRMESQMKSQAFGGAHGVGLLLDGDGDDYRYAKGKYPTGYGDAGIFDAWSQGCAQGFRGRASGGIAGVVDLQGSDYSEAGNFSQGGGYYFGTGFYHDVGQEDDWYVGSRYNQGFCAHQAVGVFLEEGGNDLYQTRQSVSQGLAWDECSTVFMDYGGDDTYEGGGGFSQGASAHNAICLMWDLSGNDTYRYRPGQARAGGNDYHGGTSLSLFMDTGGGQDSYDSERSGNELVTGWPEHGFFADLPDSLAAALQDSAWEAIWQDQPEE